MWPLGHVLKRLWLVEDLMLDCGRLLLVASKVLKKADEAMAQSCGFLECTFTCTKEQTQSEMSKHGLPSSVHESA